MASKSARGLWCDRARHALKPGEKQPCNICGGHVAVVHAHHLAPIGLQFDAGMTDAIQAFSWLCPSHHSLVHLAIESALRGERAEGIEPADKADVLQEALLGMGLILKRLIEDGAGD